MQRYFVYGSAAYRSEIELFRAEHVTVGESEIVQAPPEAGEIFRIERDGQQPLFTHDWRLAHAATQSSGFLAYNRSGSFDSQAKAPPAAPGAKPDGWRSPAPFRPFLDLERTPGGHKAMSYRMRASLFY